MKHGRARPIWLDTLLCALAQLAATGLALVVFAYFHHVRPAKIADEGIEIARPLYTYEDVTSDDGASAREASAENVSVTGAPAQNENDFPFDTDEVASGQGTYGEIPTFEPTNDTTGLFATKFRDKFTSGELLAGRTADGYFYISENLNVTVKIMRVNSKNGASIHTDTVYVTDFYIRDISCLKSAFANDDFSHGSYEWLDGIASRGGAIAAINGDFASIRNYGVVIRNGHLYRSAHSSFDACAINWDGTMVTYSSKSWNADMLIQNGAYQAWSFGPELLDKNGKPMATFNATDAVKRVNPRTAIGYFEPGHYCFVTVDGRSSTSPGMTFVALSEFMSELGCVQAYNLDGGASSSLWWRGEIISKPFEGGRKISDAVYIVDSVEVAR